MFRRCFAGERPVGDATPDSRSRARSSPTGSIRPHRTDRAASARTSSSSDDAPVDDDRAIFDVDLFDPCWLWPKATLDGIGGITARVGQLPFNFRLARDVVNIVPRPAPSSLHGDLIVKLDGCRVADAGLGLCRNGRPHRIGAWTGLICRGMSFSDQESVVHTSIHSQVALRAPWSTLRSHSRPGTTPDEGRSNPAPPKTRRSRSPEVCARSRSFEFRPPGRKVIRFLDQ